MFDDKLTKRLPNAMSTAIFRDLVELVIRKVKLVTSGTGVGPEPFSWPVFRR